MRTVLYPGSFDPITFGHIDIIKRILRAFDSVIIAVADNGQKKHLFSLNERVEHIKQLFSQESRVQVDTFSGLLVDYAHKKQCHTIVRGLRGGIDFDYEFQLSSMNHSIASDIQTIFMMSHPSTCFISSSLVREAASFGGKLSQLVPDYIEQQLRRKYP